MQTKEVKHITGDGVETIFTRLYADDGKALTKDDESFWNCIDVLPDEVNDWREVDAPQEDTMEIEENA